MRREFENTGTKVSEEDRIGEGEARQQHDCQPGHVGGNGLDVPREGRGQDESVQGPLEQINGVSGWNRKVMTGRK